MTSPGGPALGEMQLYDAVLPPLKNDTYKLSASTSVSGGNFPLPPRDSYFAIEGPRFALAATEVSSVHPPRNAVGFFEEVLPHVVLGRRTLPWERDLDPAGLIPAPAPDPDDPEPRPLQGTPPWLALLVFGDDPEAPEAKVLTQVPLSTVVTDGAVLARLNPGGDPLVDAVEAPGPLLRRLLPTKDEATLLCHVRRVNVDDRELAAGDSDGWFAVVMANRLPAPGHRHRACLVSIEQRTDLVPSVPWRSGDAVPPAPATARLVLLHTWTFTAAPVRPGGGSFRELAVGLDSGLVGKDTPGITDTGHVPVTLQDRSGSQVDVWYRGPLCPRPVARDALGPYHSADQARRVSPETGLEDVSYSAAFELGRLLAAADPRLGQELMRWRREAYRQAARSSVATTVWSSVPQMVADASDGLRQGMVAPVAVTVLERAGAGAGASADIQGLQTAGKAPGMDPEKVASAWGMTTAQASDLLRGAGEPPADAPTQPDVLAARDRMAATQARHEGALE